MTNITNIQRYCIHDGDGIRTTVFFKGCPLSCHWCHNPENIAFEPQMMFYADRCAGCGACVRAAPQGLAHMENGRPVFGRDPSADWRACVAACPREALEMAGMAASVQDIVQRCLLDQSFYEESSGGVTLSGGEVMAQDVTFLAALTKALKREGLNIAIDTCGHAPWAHFEAVLPWVDTFLYDIKLMDPQRHRHYMGQDNALILENLTRLSRQGADLHLRLPLIEGVNATDGDIEAIGDFLREHSIHPRKISLLPYHSTGAQKRARLALGRPDDTAAAEAGFGVPTPQRMEHMAQLLRDRGLGPVSIGG